MTREAYLKKELNLYQTMINGLDETIRGLDDINESLIFLRKNVNDLLEENKTIEVENVNKGFVDFDESLQELRILRRQINKSLDEVNQKLNNKNYKGEEEVQVSEFVSLQKRSQTVIDLLAASLDYLKPVKSTVEKLYIASRNCLDNRDNYTSVFCELMGNVYTNSYGAQIKIEQVSKKVKTSVEKGTLHDVIMADSTLKTSIEQLKKETNKR